MNSLSREQVITQLTAYLIVTLIDFENARYALEKQDIEDDGFFPNPLVKRHRTKRNERLHRRQYDRGYIKNQVIWFVHQIENIRLDGQPQGLYLRQALDGCSGFCGNFELQTGPGSFSDRRAAGVGNLRQGGELGSSKPDIVCAGVQNPNHLVANNAAFFLADRYGVPIVFHKKKKYRQEVTIWGLQLPFKNREHKLLSK